MGLQEGIQVAVFLCPTFFQSTKKGWKDEGIEVTMVQKLDMGVAVHRQNRIYNAIPTSLFYHDILLWAML